VIYLIIENYKSSYKDAIILSSLFLTLGGLISYALVLAEHMLISVILLLFITYQSAYFFKTIYDYNKNLEAKKHLFIVKETLNVQQKHWFLVKMEEELSKRKKPIFWDQQQATAVYYYLCDKITNNKPLSDHEQYVLNLFLIDYLDLDQIARNWIVLHN
jgi:hypothetical protein